MERQAFLFQNGHDYPQYWIFYTAALLMWLLIIPIISKRNIDIIGVIGFAFMFQLCEDWGYWLFSGQLSPGWYPFEINWLGLPFFYWLDITIGLPLIAIWIYKRK